MSATPSHHSSPSRLRAALLAALIASACRAGAAEGEPCGGYTSNPVACASGLTCCIRPDLPDLGGVCIPVARQPKRGQACGGPVPICCAELTCQDRNGGHL